MPVIGCLLFQQFKVRVGNVTDLSNELPPIQIVMGPGDIMFPQGKVTFQIFRKVR